MSRRPVVVALLALLAAFTPAAAQRPAAGRIGAYTPPKVWPQRERVFDLLHQRIAIGFNLEQHAVTGEVTTRLIITGPPTGTVRLDASNLSIDAAFNAGGQLRFTSDTSSVTVMLGRTARTGDTVEFTLRYHGNPERGMYFVPRRPTMWTQGEAIETPSWVPTYNAPNDKTTWEILVTADSGMSVLSNGRLVSVTPTADGRQKVWHWSQEKPASTYLYSIVASRFAILRDSWRGIPVEYWTSPDTVDATWRTFGETPAMIETFSRVLGVNFPWAKYDQAIIPDFTYGGMENVTATTQTDLALHPAASEPEFSGRGLDSHELAHQWFGDLTTTATWAHAWINEGLTTYMESVHEEQSRGREAAQWNWLNEQQQAMDADRNQERPLVFGEQAGTDPIQIFFSGHVYPKGAQLAHQLRRLVGDSLFWAGMRRFLTDNAYKPVETADYAIAMEKATNRDLDWFFDQWAYGIGYPKVKVTRAWNPASRTLRLTVDETQAIDATHPFFRFPATVRVTTRDSVVRHEVMVTARNQAFDIPLPSAPLEFRFDEGGWLLGTITTDQTPAELAALASHDLDFTGRIWALRQLRGSADSAAHAARRLVSLNDENLHMRAEAVRQLGQEKGTDAVGLVLAALKDPAGGVRAAALESFARLDSVGAQAFAQVLATSDPSTVVQVSAVGLIDPRTSPAAEALLVDRLQHGGPLALRLTAASRLHLQPDAVATQALVGLTDPSEPRDLRQSALGMLATFPDKAAAIAAATRYLADGDPLFASAAARQLATIGGDAGRASLQAALQAERRVTVRAALTAALAAKR